MNFRKIGAMMLSLTLLFGSIGLYRLPIHAASATKPSVSAGNDYVILLKDDGSAWSWGYNGMGQLGTNSVELGGKAMNPIAVTMPQKDGSPVKFQQISAGVNHVLALATDGSVWAWGDNGSGQLGTGNETSSRIPVQVVSDFGDGEVTQVVAGTNVSYALLQDGSVYSWGIDSNGLLGNGASLTDAQSTPQKIEALNGVSAIYAGESTAAAIVAGGRVYLWGKNDSLQGGAQNPNSIVSPTEKMSTYTAHCVALGRVHSTLLSIDSSGRSLKSFGSNPNGQFGNGSTSTGKSDSLTSATLPSDLSGIPKTIVAGSEHMLMLTDSGAVYAWGSNVYDQLGLTPDNSSNLQKTPKRVSALADYNIVEVDASHRLNVALDELGSVYIWGFAESDGSIGSASPTSLKEADGDPFNLGLPPIYREYPVYVTATATVPRPTYTVTIPSSVQPSALHQKRTDAPDSERINTTVFSVSATGISNFFGEQRIEVSLSTDDDRFLLQDSLNHTIGYTVYNSVDSEEPLASGDLFAIFRETDHPSDTQTVTGRIEIDQSHIQFSGEYSDRVEFTVSLVPDTEEGGEGE